MISFQNQEQIGQLFAALLGRYRQPLALRIVIGVIMLAAGGGAFFLGIMTFLEGNDQLSRAYELLVSAIMILVATLAFYYAYYMNQIVYEIEENRFRAFLMPDHLRWEVSREEVDCARFISSSNGEQLELHCTDGRVRRMLCTSEMRRIIEAVHQNILSQQPPIPVSFDPRKKLRLAIFGVLLLAAPIILLVIQRKMLTEQEHQRKERIDLGAYTTVERTFSDPAGYTIFIPEGWRLTDHTKKNQLIRADITKCKDAGVQVRLQKCSPGDFVEMEKATSHQYKLDMSKHWGGDCVEFETATPRKDTVTRRFRLDRKDGQRWYMQLTCVCTECNLIVMQGGCLWDDQKMFADAFDVMVTDIQFEPIKGAPHCPPLGAITGRFSRLPGRISDGVPFSGRDAERVRFAFLLITPREDYGQYLVVLSQLARMMHKESNRAAFLECKTPKAASELIAWNGISEQTTTN